MRYAKPFTSIQRQDAIRVYLSYRTALDHMRFTFPASNRAERRVLRAYREAVHDFARLLSEKDAKVNAVRLNSTKERADRLCLQYAGLWNQSHGRSGRE
jgi:hypothetical protein